jgi:hypothetical protein
MVILFKVSYLARIDHFLEHLQSHLLAFCDIIFKLFLIKFIAFCNGFSVSICDLYFVFAVY